MNSNGSKDGSDPITFNEQEPNFASERHLTPSRPDSGPWPKLERVKFLSMHLQ